MERTIEYLSGLNAERKKIFSIIQKQGPISKSAIVESTGMKLSTLNRVMQPLEEQKLIVARIGESSGGRKPSLYDVNPADSYIAGIDLSRTYTRVVIANLKMDMLSSEQFQMDESYSPEKTISEIVRVIYAALNKLGIDRSKLSGAGIGSVGPMDRLNGVMLNPINFPAAGWSNVPVKSMLSSRLNCPVIMDNGANAAVLAESLFGEGKKYRSMAYFNCGIGIRTGAVTSGTIIRAMNDSEDAFGHMTIDVDGEPCSCGNYGCIECYSSITPIVRNFVTSLKKGRSTTVSKAAGEITFKDICSAAKKNDALAKEVISDAAAIFGAGLANYANLINPNLIVLSGPLIECSKLFYDVCIETAVRKRYLQGENKIVFSRGGHFRENAIAVGAAAMVVEKSLGNI